MSNVIAFPRNEAGEIDPDIVLASSLGEFPGGVILIGYGEDGTLEIRTSFAQGRDVIWVIENAKHGFLSGEGA